MSSNLSYAIVLYRPVNLHAMTEQKSSESINSIPFKDLELKQTTDESLKIECVDISKIMDIIRYTANMRFSKMALKEQWRVSHLFDGHLHRQNSSSEIIVYRPVNLREMFVKNVPESIESIRTEDVTIWNS